MRLPKFELQLSTTAKTLKRGTKSIRTAVACGVSSDLVSDVIKLFVAHVLQLFALRF